MECLQREYQVKNITVPDSEAFNFTFDSTPATVRKNINSEGVQEFEMISMGESFVSILG